MLSKSRPWSAEPTLGERMAARMRELGMKKADLVRAMKARGMKISNAAVGQWERNQTKNLKLENVFAVADVLEVSPRELAIGQPDIPIELQPDEREMLKLYREAPPHWRLTLRLLGKAPERNQDEVSESINLIMAEIFGRTPASDARVEAAYGRPPSLHQPRAEYAREKKK